MEKMNNGKMIETRCPECGKLMFRRRGNVLIAYGISFEMKRSHKIECSCGRGSAMFCVLRREISVAKSAEKG